jgi:hypothetical protein
MSGPLRPCGREECRLCNPDPEPDADSLASVFIAAAFLFMLFILCFVFLPVLA